MSLEVLSKANKPNYVARADYGVRVARPGFDARTCAQNQLLFNTGWPILQIARLYCPRQFARSEKWETIHGFTKYTKVRVVDTSDYSVISIKTTRETVSSAPQSYLYKGTQSAQQGWLYSERASANRKYLRIFDEETTYVVSETDTYDGNIWTNTQVGVQEFSGYRIKHGLGYTPLFAVIEPESLDAARPFGSGETYILFSVDLEKDVDYPYTEAPLPFLSAGHDYGILSESIFGSNVPGLNTMQFSKLVQAVKTSETSVSGDGSCVWTPLDKNSTQADVAGCLNDYEARAYFALSDKTDEDGGNYYQNTMLFYYGAVGDQSLGAAFMTTTNNVVLGSGSSSALVVLRMPMVSPEYEEKTI